MCLSLSVCDTTDAAHWSIKHEPTPKVTPVLHVCKGPHVFTFIVTSVLRKFDLSSFPVMPTWIPFMSTRADEGQLDFSLQLMTGTCQHRSYTHTPDWYMPALLLRTLSVWYVGYKQAGRHCFALGDGMTDHICPCDLENVNLSK